MKQRKTSSPEFYTLPEVAKKLRLSRMTVFRYVRDKKLPAYRFGKDYRVRPKDLDAFLSSHKL
jgi:excisionase family DNA binding protein